MSQYSFSQMGSYSSLPTFSKKKKHLTLIGQMSEFPWQATGCDKKSQSQVRLLPTSLSRRSKNNNLQQLVGYLHSAQKRDFTNKSCFKGVIIFLYFFSEMKSFGEPGVESNYIMDELHILAKHQSIPICNLLTPQGCSSVDRRWPGSTDCSRTM